MERTTVNLFEWENRLPEPGAELDGVFLEEDAAVRAAIAPAKEWAKFCQLSNRPSNLSGVSW